MATAAISLASPVRLRVRRNVRWIAAGVLVMVLGGLGSWLLYNQLADVRPALKLTRTVYRGQALTASDLSVVSVGRTLDVPVVSGHDASTVVGQFARTDLAAGSLLVPGSTGAAELGSGVARVGVKLEAGRLPSGRLAPGTSVDVVAVGSAAGAAGNAAAGATPAALPKTVAATLASSPSAAADGSVLVDLDVPAAAAEQVARLAASKQIVLVQRGA